MRMLANEISLVSADVTFIDCGADIGIVSAHAVSRCPNITRVIAFEPNRAAFRILDANLKSMRITAEARHAAVGKFCGRGRLTRSPDDPSAHAMYIAPCDDGPVQVERVDDLKLEDGRSCVIKIDVEGSEAAVVEGAAETIRRAGEVIVAFEAHPGVAQRLGRDPLEVMHALLAIRPDFIFSIDKGPTPTITATRPIFEQVPPTLVYNIIARSSTS
jgi:FkbM family methyltransferase